MLHGTPTSIMAASVTLDSVGQTARYKSAPLTMTPLVAVEEANATTAPSLVRAHAQVRMVTLVSFPRPTLAQAS